MTFFSKSQDDTISKKSLPGLMKPASASAHGTTAFLGKLSIILGILFVVAVFSSLSPKITVLQRRLYRSVPKTRCIVYDRPPRTGSTTISKALAKCFSSRGYNVAKLVSHVRSSAVASMVSSETDRMAMGRSHVAISQQDLQLLEDYCGKLLYITSAAPMKARLYSALKYSLTSYHGNSSIERDMVDFAERRAKKSRSREDFLEAYPHVTEEGKPLRKMPKRIVPDYVIRKETLDEDLISVMDALGCNTTFRSSNVHVASTEESMALDAIKLYSGDSMYKWLLDVAKDNEQGLKKARSF